MTADFSLLLLAGLLCAVGTYLMLERTIIKILLGIMLAGNGINLLLLAAGGPPGSPPVLGRFAGDRAGDSDTLSQAMILTSIVITAGVGAFILALAYRSYRYTTADEVADDPEDARVAARSPRDAASAPDRDRSDDQRTGRPTDAGDHVDYDGEDEGEDGAGGDDGEYGDGVDRHEPAEGPLCDEPSPDPDDPEPEPTDPRPGRPERGEPDTEDELPDGSPEPGGER